MKFIVTFLIWFFCISLQQPIIFSSNNGRLSFKSEAPMELINASSNEMKGAIDVTKNNFAFRIRIRSFEGFNSPLQKEHFNENYLESEKYPEATFNGKIIETIDFTKKGKYTIRAKGILMVHGIELERIIKSEIEITPTGIKVNAGFTILLSDYNIPIPRVVKEKLANEIKVEVSTMLLPK